MEVFEFVKPQRLVILMTFYTSTSIFWTPEAKILRSNKWARVQVFKDKFF